jgi:methylated-DNA-[protein]-cysteine S-methyltransferase
MAAAHETPGVARFATPIGTCSVAWTSRGICRFELPAEPAGDPTPDGAVPGGPQPAWVAPLIDEVRLHLSGTPRRFMDYPLDWGLVSAFQRGVYEATRDVPPGSTTTYGQLAALLGLGPDASRAVGTALGSNPWPLLIPCHRVVARDGRMTGFSAPGGIATKTRLLAIEGAELPLA